MNAPIPYTAIIIDADKLCQIAIIQDLGRRGIPIVAIAANASAIGFRSRYVGRRIISPVPSHDVAYADFLLDEVPRGVLYYSNDAAAEMMARNRRILSDGGFSFLVSGPEVLEKLANKEQLYITASECGVRVPNSRLVAVSEAAQGAAAVGFPCILKSTNLAGGVYEPVASADAVEPAVRRMQAAISGADWRHRRANLMVQEWIPQDDTTLWNFNALVKNGEIVSFSMGTRIRTDIRRDGAIGSMLLYGRTGYHPDVHEANRRLLRHVRYDGIMETEWSQSRSDPKSLYLYDFNPRPSGNFRWTLKSGVPMALQYYQLSLGRIVTGNRAMNSGVPYFKIVTRQNDFLWALKNPRLSAFDKTRVLAQNLRALLRPGRNAIDIFDPGDPGPTAAAACEAVSYCWEELARVFKQRLFKRRQTSFRRVET